MEGVVEHSGKVVSHLLLRNGTGLPDDHNDNCNVDDDDNCDDNCNDDDDHPEHTGEGGVAEKEKDEEDEIKGFQARWSCHQEPDQDSQGGQDDWDDSLVWFGLVWYHRPLLVDYTQRCSISPTFLGFGTPFSLA